MIIGIGDFILGGSGGSGPSDWILATGVWRDEGLWDDDAFWID